jgi:oligopeptide/dipeptide ABC transporter ATP-binding protein
LSGGLRQRVMIALALAAEPRVLIADEPTTALDVTTQAQILELIRGCNSERDLAVILITHDMGVIAEMADDVVVMYLGREVEKGPVDTIFHAPAHPYTRALLRSIPSVLAEPRARLATIAGSIPHPFARPSGCPFHPRCPDACRPLRCRVAGRRSRSARHATGLPSVYGAGAGMTTPVLEVQGLRKYFPIRGGLFGALPASPRGGRRQLHHRARRDAVAGRRVRVRQDHDLPLHPARDHADRRGNPVSGTNRRSDRRRGLIARGCARCGGRCR